MLGNKTECAKMGETMTKLAIVLVAFVCGAMALAGVDAIFDYTSRTEFCISCHTMRWNYEEYKTTVHYKNRLGIKTECADCHVPKEFFPKVVSKIIALKDVYHQFAGTIDTREKFDAHRWAMANRVWDKMKASDSRECRSCHEYQDMDLSVQAKIAMRRHEKASMEGKSCIECHKGIVHQIPQAPVQAAAAQP